VAFSRLNKNGGSEQTWERSLLSSKAEVTRLGKAVCRPKGLETNMGKKSVSSKKGTQDGNEGCRPARGEIDMGKKSVRQGGFPARVHIVTLDKDFFGVLCIPSDQHSSPCILCAIVNTLDKVFLHDLCALNE
jgi:hypothetical protein